MASILVYIELDGEHPRSASLQVLGAGRRMATALGGVLYALVPVPETVTAMHEIEDRLVQSLGAAGADKVVIMSVGAGPGPILWESHGAALHAVCTTLKPTLVLLPATAAGHDMGARLAARLDALFMAQPRVEHEPGGDVVLCGSGSEGPLIEQISLAGLRRPLVVTLTPGAHAPALGYDEAEALCIEPVTGASAKTCAIEHCGSTPDPGRDLSQARVIVVAGAGVGSAEGFRLAGELARALGGELAATPSLCALGIAPPERAVGLGLRHVSPALYVVCAASGSPEHLAAVAPDARIIAINNDPDAPIFAVARYGLAGDIHTVIPMLVSALEQGSFDPEAAVR